MSYGKIYETTWWGNPVKDGWGNVYYDFIESEDFIMTVRTTTASESFTIPTTTGTYLYDVDWGDGTVTTGATGNATHTYTTSGDYDIKISGTFPRIYFNNTGDKDKLIAVKNLGIVGWTSFERAFYGCSNLETVVSGNTDTSSVTRMDIMFLNCTSLTNIDVSNWDVSSVTRMDFMFRNCTSLTTLDVSNWDVSSVTNVFSMFRDCNSLTTLDVSGWDVSSVTNMERMFNNCDNFDNDLSLWDITSVTNFTNFMLAATGLSTANYDATLIGWEATLQAAFPNGVGYTPTISINFGGSQYTAGGAADTARQSLINNFNWTIVDGGSI